ncbi:T9SS type A sorting domain-containing protein [Chitinophaga solisilvae]|uniref:T9SS type A sorting domain-containing protein n=1 Tax=Chitinophaga solisilvae TaxID=1233460 RepID=UPI001369B447|nr:T9SS type A sorting domain-containing protein [Chitinophaga solisilvae]
MKPFVLLPFMALNLSVAAQDVREPGILQAPATPMQQELHELGQSLRLAAHRISLPVTADPAALSLVQGEDYFPAAGFVDNTGKPSGADVPHRTTVERYTGTAILLDGQKSDDVTCYRITDEYTLKGKLNPAKDFNYSNIYFLFKDKEGKPVATAYYIRMTVDFLSTEHRFVMRESGSLHSAAVSHLEVAPNPAGKNISIRFQAAHATTYTIRIVDMNGRIMQTILQNRRTEPGAHIVNANLDLPSGAYLVRIESASGAPVTQKLIIR